MVLSNTHVERRYGITAIFTDRPRSVVLTDITTVFGENGTMVVEGVTLHSVARCFFLFLYFRVLLVSQATVTNDGVRVTNGHRRAR